MVKHSNGRAIRNRFMVGYQEKDGISMMGVVFRYIEEEDTLEYVDMSKKNNSEDIDRLQIAGVRDFIEQGQLGGQDASLVRVMRSYRDSSFEDDYGIIGYFGNGLGHNKCVIELEDEEQGYGRRYFYGVARLDIEEGDLAISVELKDVRTDKLVNITDELYDYITIEYGEKIMGDILKVINCYSYWSEIYKKGIGLGQDKWIEGDDILQI